MLCLGQRWTYIYSVHPVQVCMKLQHTFHIIPLVKTLSLASLALSFLFCYWWDYILWFVLHLHWSFIWIRFHSIFLEPTHSYIELSAIVLISLLKPTMTLPEYSFHWPYLSYHVLTNFLGITMVIVHNDRCFSVVFFVSYFSTTTAQPFSLKQWGNQYNNCATNTSASYQFATKAVISNILSEGCSISMVMLSVHALFHVSI